MTYSCADFNDDVLAAFVRHGFIDKTKIVDEDQAGQAQLCITALARLNDALRLAQRALNTAPRFKIKSLPPSTDDSYKVAAALDAIFKTTTRPL